MTPPFVQNDEWQQAMELTHLLRQKLMASPKDEKVREDYKASVGFLKEAAGRANNVRQVNQFAPLAVGAAEGLGGVAGAMAGAPGGLVGMMAGTVLGSKAVKPLAKISAGLLPGGMSSEDMDMFFEQAKASDPASYLLASVASGLVGGAAANVIKRRALLHAYKVAAAERQIIRLAEMKRAAGTQTVLDDLKIENARASLLLKRQALLLGQQKVPKELERMQQLVANGKLELQRKTEALARDPLLKSKLEEEITNLQLRNARLEQQLAEGTKSWQSSALEKMGFTPAQTEQILGAQRQAEVAQAARLATDARVAASGNVAPSSSVAVRIEAEQAKAVAAQARTQIDAAVQQADATVTDVANQRVQATLDELMTPTFVRRGGQPATLTTPGQKAPPGPQTPAQLSANTPIEIVKQMLAPQRVGNSWENPLETGAVTMKDIEAVFGRKLTKAELGQLPGFTASGRRQR